MFYTKLPELAPIAFVWAHNDFPGKLEYIMRSI